MKPSGSLFEGGNLVVERLGHPSRLLICPNEHEATRQANLGQVAIGPREVEALACVSRVFAGAKVLELRRASR